VNAQTATIPACEVCGRERTQTKGGRSLCDSDSCLTALPGTRDQEQGTRNSGSEGVRALYVVGSPGPGNTVPKEEPSSHDGSKGEEPELLGLIRDNKRGELEPADVQLGVLPANASKAMRRVAEDIRLLIGLRLAVDEYRPLPYSTRFCAERCGLRHHTQASRVLRDLERAGVVKCAEPLKPRGKGDGTKTYRAPA
jgi:hypothetical protein